MNWLDHICIFFSIILVCFIFWKVFYKDIRKWIKAPSFTPPRPVTIQVNQQGNIIHNAEEKPASAYVIDASDIAYYREKNADVVHQYNMRKAEYAPIQALADTPLLPHATRAHEPEDIDMDAILLHHIVRDISGDSQNVHDSAVQNTVKHLYEQLPDASSDPSPNQLAHEIAQYAERTDLPKDKLEDVRFATQRILERNASVYNVENEREGDVLARVWTTGNEAVKRQLLNELVDCKDNSVSLWNGGEPSIYCPTGVVTRILNATTIENPDQMPRTRAVLRQEMLQTAAKVREECEASEAYKLAPPETQQEQFKRRLEQAYQKQYDGVVSMDLVQEEMNSWIDSV